MRAHEKVLTWLESSKKTSESVVLDSSAQVSGQAAFEVRQTKTTADINLSPIITKISLRADEMASLRARAESNLSASAEVDVKTAAEGRLAAAENKIAEVGRFVEKVKANLGAEATVEAEARLKLADEAIISGRARLEARLEAEAYNDAFLLFYKAHRLAQEDQMLI